MELIFFVISGFLITAILKEEIQTTGSINLKQFYDRRFRRLQPALLVTLLVLIIFATILMPFPHGFNSIESLIFAFMGLSNFKFWLSSGYF